MKSFFNSFSFLIPKTQKQKDILFWLESSFLLIIYTYFIVINIVQPSGAIRWTWHFGIWLPLTTLFMIKNWRYIKIYKLAIKGIFNMDSLIGLAAHAAYTYSFIQAFINIGNPIYTYDAMWVEPVFVITFANIGHWLENRVGNNVSAAYDELNKLKESKVHLVKSNGEIIDVDPKDVEIGSKIIVKKGEILLLDGKLLSNFAVFDNANINGESKPQQIKKSSKVISGGFNLSEAIEILVSKNFYNSFLNTIISAIQKSPKTNEKLLGFAAKILKYFVPFVMIAALFTLILWLGLGYGANFAWSWADQFSPLNNAIKAMIATLAIACPCAIGLAIPLISSITYYHLLKKGVYANSPEALENLKKAKIIAFDKTGTITQSKLGIHSVEGDKSFLDLAITLESHFDHPIASAVKSLKTKNFKNQKIIEIEHLINGVKGIYKDKVIKIVTSEKETKEGYTIVNLIFDGEIKLEIKLENTIRKNVKKTILKLIKLGYRVCMITGDQKGVALYVANIVGIKEVYYQKTSIEKVQILKNLQKDGDVIFVGDGFNDSLVIKEASFSMAFSSGSSISNNLADISLINNNFETIYNVLKIGKLNNFNVKKSLFWASIFNIVVLPLAILLIVQAWVAAFIMLISDVFVLLNALYYKKISLRKMK